MKTAIRKWLGLTQASLQRFRQKYSLKEARMVLGSSINKGKSEELLLSPQTYANQKIKEVKFKEMQYPELNKFFRRYFNSKPVEGRVSGKSLAFLVGEYKVGKSFYLQKNLHQIKLAKQQIKLPNNLQSSKTMPIFDQRTSPESFQQLIQERIFDNPHYLIINLDFSEDSLGKGLNYTGFVQILHESILAEIRKILIKFTSKTKEFNLLSPIVVRDIVLHAEAPQYLFIYFKDVIYSILEEKDLIQLSQEGRQALQEINIRVLENSRELFYEQIFFQIVNLIWNDRKKRSIALKRKDQFPFQKVESFDEGTQRTLISIELFYSVFARIEYENRPEQYLFSWYRSGIETTNFLFQILDFLSGTGHYLRNIQSAFTTSSSAEERTTIRNKLLNSDNYILRGGHVDTMLCLSNIGHLACFQDRNRLFLDFFDHLVCRLAEQSNFRKHFPVLIEIPNRAFLDQIFQLGKIQAGSIPIIQIPGYMQKLLKFSNVADIFSQKFITKVFPILGRNPNVWKCLLQYMGRGGNLELALDGLADYQCRGVVSSMAKLNRIYLEEECLSYLNQGTLDFQLLKCLEVFNKVGGMGVSFKPFYGNILFKQPFFTAMLRLNIFYHHYYTPYMDYQHLPIMRSACGQFEKQLKTIVPFWRYKLWRRKQEFEYKFRQLRYNAKIQKILYQNRNFGKEHIDYELYTTYYGPLYDYSLEYSKKAYITQVLS